MALVEEAPAHVMAVLGDVGEMEEVAEGADDGERLARAQPREEIVEVAARGFVGLALECGRQPPDRLDDLEGFLPDLLANGVAEDLAEQSRVVVQGAVLLGRCRIARCRRKRHRRALLRTTLCSAAFRSAVRKSKRAAGIADTASDSEATAAGDVGNCGRVVQSGAARLRQWIEKMRRLDGKVALITGAARGIGAAIARRFTEEGAKVIVNDLDLEAARATAKPLGGHGVAADVADSAGVAAMFAEVGSSAALDILVNNAGISGMEGRNDAEEIIALRLKQAEEIAGGGPVETFLDVTVQTTDGDWRRMLDVHLDGTFYCSREALKIMNPQMSGASSTCRSWAPSAARQRALLAAKAAILGFTRALAREVAPRNIRVNAIAPGLDRHRHDRAARR